MTKRLVILILAATVLLSGKSLAQTSDNPWMAGLSATFLDYQGPLTGDYTQYKTFNPGISFGAHTYISRLLNFSLNSSFVPQVKYPTTETQFLGTSLIDVNTLVQFKSNGTIFDEHAFWAPYISAGFGLNSASNNLRLYVPAALGMRFRFSRNFSLALESMYKLGLGQGNYQHMAHTVGFVFALPSNRRPVRPDPEEKPEKERPAIAELPDTDNDGIPDRDDLCPDIKGKALFLGCPEEEKEEVPVEQQEVEIVEVQPEPQEIIDESVTKTEKANTVEVEETPAIVEEEISQEDQEYMDLAMDNIYFEQGSDRLTTDSYAILDKISSILRKYPSYNLQVMGHTDNTGSGNDNLVLSIKRAYKVKYYLVYEKGIKLARISSDGYSSVAPIAENSTNDGRARNRRVEFRLIKENNNGLGLQQSQSY